MKKGYSISLFIFLLFAAGSLRAQIPSPAVWLMGDSVVLNGTLVDTLIDVSGHGRYAAQSTPSTQPIWIDSVPQLNNKPVIRFDGVGTYMLIDSSAKVGELFIVANYLGGNSSFNGYPGLFDPQLSADGPYILTGINNPDFGYAGLFAYNLFINGTQTISFGPSLNLYKIISGDTSTPHFYTDFIIGRDREYAGRYWEGDVAEIIIYDTILSVSQRQQVMLYLNNKYAPPVNLGPDIVKNNVCPDTLDAGSRFLSFKWNNNPVDSNQKFIVTKSGTYYVEAVNLFGSHSFDTIVVTYPLNQISDTSLCSGDTLVWNTNLTAPYTFQWSDGSTSSILKITSTGQYSVSVTDSLGCPFASDTITATFDNFPLVASLGGPTSFCSGNSIGLVSGANRAQTYLWNDGSTTATLIINTTGTYYVTVTDTLGCIKKDSDSVTITGTGPIVNFSSTSTCLGFPMQFTDSSIQHGSDILTSWFWTFGDPASGVNDTSILRNPNHLYSDTLVHLVTLKVTAQSGCSNSITKNVKVFPNPKPNFIVSNTCEGTVATFTNSSNVFNDPSPSYLWNFGDPASGSNNVSSAKDTVHVFNSVGSYNVTLTVTNSNGCFGTVQHIVKVNPPSYCFTPNQLSGLQLWLAGDMGVTKSNDSVSLWHDQSGGTRNAHPPSIATEPQFIDSIVKLNYKPVLRFDGVADMLFVDTTVTVGEAYIIANYLDMSNTTFQNYYGLITAPGDTFFLTAYSGKNSLIGSISNTNLFQNNIFINDTQKLNFDPFNRYKIISGFSQSPTPFSFDSLFIAHFGNYNDSRYATSRYWNGDIAEIIVYDSILSDSSRQNVMQYIRNKYAPPVDLGPDIVTQNLCSVTLDAGPRFISYAWNGGSPDTIQTFKVTNSGTYYVEAVDVFGFHSTDTVVVTYPLHQLPDTNVLCFGDTLIWNTQLNPPYSFLWNDASTNSLLRIVSAGQYWVKITDTSGCTLTSRTINVNADNFPQVATLGANDTLCSGNSIGLTVGANRAQFYQWNTGSSNDTIVVNSTGQYWVIVTDSFGCTKQDTINVHIKGVAPVANFYVAATCFGQAMQFNDSSYASSGTIVSWKWDFDDTISGSSDSSIMQNPTHLFSDTLIHHVSLIVGTDSGCYSVVSKSVNIIPKPKADYSYINACLNTTTTFNNTSFASGDFISQWFWDFGDPASGIYDTSSLQNPTHIFVNDSTYSVTLIIRTNNGCSDTVTKSVIIQNAITANFTSSAACWLSITQFTNFSTPFNLDSVCKWDFGDGTYDQNCNPSHIYAFPGTYHVTLTMIAFGGCTTTVTKNVVVSDIPVSKPNSPPACIHNPYSFAESSTITSGSIVRWDWQIPELGLHFDNMQNPVYTFDTLKTYTLFLKVTSDAGCVDTASTTVTVYPLAVPNFTFSPPYGAPPLTIHTSNLSTNATTYQWDFGDGTAGSTSPNPQHTYVDTGQFVIHLIATSSEGCSDSITKRIYVITPYLDVAVTHVSASLANNQLAISAIIANLGTIDVDSVIMQARLDNGTSIDEKNTHALPTGTSQAYQFVAHFNVEPSTTISYYCVSAIHPNNVVADNDTADDRKCSSLVNQISLVEPYPNPFTSTLHLDVVAPFEDQLTIELYNNLGQQIAILYDGEVTIGLNSISANLSSLADGIYTLRFSFLDQQLIRQVMKVSSKK